MSVAWTRALALLVLLAAVSGCASVGSPSLLAARGDLVWDCGWRPMP
ncbi:MAG TPA: hypothetical protein VML54_13695 [Candidatus Limnocylindrales bacterium]|nr:hypothetical protein [Candidatus Limnocylindrales bacterium]